MAILAALPDPVLVVDRYDTLRYVNTAAEEFLGIGATALIGRPLAQLLDSDHPILALIDRARALPATLTEHDVRIDPPRREPQLVTATVSPQGDAAGPMVVSLRVPTVGERMDRQRVHRNAARSVSAMAAMLAHEVKNPLSAIRGAAQLLEGDADDGDRELARLIRDEVDRIRALVDRMDLFSDSAAEEFGPVNIHSVLEHVRRAAKAGFARDITVMERYDPSLPPVRGSRDQLIQVLLNLVKNAAEAVPPVGGEIVLITRYQAGVSIRPAQGRAGAEGRVHVPLQIIVQDNGPGIPEELRAHLFDPFITTKRKGTGLGLALVAKLVGDHGGTVAFDSRPGRTAFTVSLPMFEDAEMQRG